MKFPTPKVPPDWRVALVLGLCFVLCVVLCTILILLYLWDRDRRNREAEHRRHVIESPQRVLSDQYVGESEEARSDSRIPERLQPIKYRKCLKSLIINHEVPPPAPHAPGPSDGPTDTHTSAREHLATTASIHSTSTQNESIAPSSTPTISTTERHSTTTGIRPASHFQQRNDITGSSITSGSPVSPERLHRSATSPSAASTPSATGSSLTGRASTSCASPDTTATAPKHPATAATAPDVNPVTPTRRRLLPVIIDYVESSRNNAQPTNKSSEVNFICTPPGYKLPPQPKGDGSATSDAQKGK